MLNSPTKSRRKDNIASTRKQHYTHSYRCVYADDRDQQNTQQHTQLSVRCDTRHTCVRLTSMRTPKKGALN